MSNTHHDYDNVDLETVWRVVVNQLPILRQQIKTLIKQLDEIQ